MKCTSVRIQWGMEAVTSLLSDRLWGDISQTSLLSCVCTPGPGSWDVAVILNRSQLGNIVKAVPSGWITYSGVLTPACSGLFLVGLWRSAGRAGTAHLLAPLTAWKNMPSVAVNIFLKPLLSLDTNEIFFFSRAITHGQKKSYMKWLSSQIISRSFVNLGPSCLFFFLKSYSFHCLFPFPNNKQKLDHRIISPWPHEVTFLALPLGLSV